jgi:HAD superfamily hydrolase (TIGR01509 family)
MTTQVVLFDLGGVLVQLGGVDHFGQLVGLDDPEEVWRRWLTSPAVRRFERGHCTGPEFAEEMVEENALALSAEEFLEVFRNWPKGLLAGAHDMVIGLSESVQVACLSNTNTLHWNEQQDADVVQRLFDLAFLSHEIGLVKPDADIFEHVVQELACAPGEILFFDDNALNVDAARGIGLDAHKVVGVAPTRALLHERGLLSARPARPR